MELLVVNAAAVWFLAGLVWFVQLVHYPLFAGVGSSGWTAYHDAHSRRTSWVVAPAMLADLVTSLALVAFPPAGVAGSLLIAGAALSMLTWAVTGGLAVPLHRRLDAGFEPAAGTRLVAVNWLRTLAWSAHAVLAGVALAQAG